MEYSLNYLVFRTPDTTKRVLLDEIHTLIVQSTAVSLTTSLIAELTKRKIKVIFCDEKSEPTCELSPFYGSHNCAGRIFEQVAWTEESKGLIWKRIVEEKIKNQEKSLRRKAKHDEAKLLREYSLEVLPGDASNREGHAAKVYFNAIYFKGFTRDKECDINKYLDYGYTVLLAAFNRAVTSAGYLTQLGIHHKNE
ncbi:MAG: type II CRISPR-associated endonuclease Cas1, partial [Bacilli bacterium]|nr:type II CRISPR-associated endonuclease Cas1 [Bacilli bacterium]